jgi:hypothetical protein
MGILDHNQRIEISEHSQALISMNLDSFTEQNKAQFKSKFTRFIMIPCVFGEQDPLRKLVAIQKDGIVDQSSGNWGTPYVWIDQKKRMYWSGFGCKFWHHNQELRR